MSKDMDKDGKIPFLVDNREGRTLQKVFERLEDETVEELHIAVGYFHVSGFNLIKRYLAKVQKICLIIGNETDRDTVEQLSKGHRQIISDKIATDIDSISSDEDIRTLFELYEYVQHQKIDVRVYSKTKFHAKAYIFKIKGLMPNLAMAGSSNLSLRGLGNSEDSNTELNVAERNGPAVAEFERWFDEIWKESEPYRDDLMRIIRNSTHMVRKETQDLEFVSPRDLFRTIVCEYDDFHMPTNDVLTEHQQAGVITAQNAIERYGGCIISDSVGLGKTFIGIRLIEIAQTRGSNVLILVPKSLKANWQKEIGRYFQNVKTSQSRLKIVTMTDLSRLDLRKEKDARELDSIREQYDFIVIDEAHRLRHSGEFKYDCQEYSGRKGHANLSHLKKDNTKYALLTATPINNSVMDLYMLISIFTDTARLQNYSPTMTLEHFKDYQKIVKSMAALKNEMKSGESERSEKDIVAEIDQKVREKASKLEKINDIINEVMVLRTRQNVVKDYSATSISGMPIVTEIPIVKKIDYESRGSYTELYNDVQDLIIQLKIPHISMIKYQGAAANISGLFRILLFKRLESSIHSFMVSIDRLLDKERKFKQSVEKHGLAETILKSEDNHLAEDIELTDFIDEIDTSHSDDARNFSDEGAIDDANHDIKKIEGFKSKYSGSIVLRDMEYSDPKIEQLEKIIRDMAWRKVLIFTQYADTAEYLYHNLGKFASEHNMVLDCIMGDPARISGNNAIDTNTKISWFAPRANRIMVEPKDEIDILVSTDTLSEGVNLQDCSVIINYDLPWNPMRMVQRVGRVDRIGSTSRTTVYNIVPDKELEAFLSLLEKLESKISNITSIVGKESYILSEDEELDPKTIGSRLKEARRATEYTRYENLRDANLDFQTNDAHSQAILLIRQKMADLNLVCPDDAKKVSSPYSIIRDNFEPYSFVVFRVYDAQNNEKMKNVIVVKEAGNFDTIDVNDTKILRLPHISNGIPRQKAVPYKFDQDIDEIVKHFEQNQLSNMRTNAGIMNRHASNATANSSQSVVMGKLGQIINSTQTTLVSEISDSDKQTAKLCEKSLSEHTLSFQDMAMLGKWYGDEGISRDLRGVSYSTFVKKTYDFILKHMTPARGYTPPRSAEDIRYSIVCKGASI